MTEQEHKDFGALEAFPQGLAHLLDSLREITEKEKYFSELIPYFVLLLTQNL
jgi:hypothetical protein